MQVGTARMLAREAQLGGKPGAKSRLGMIISSHPIATHRGLDSLRRGGNAVDTRVPEHHVLDGE